MEVLNHLDTVWTVVSSVVTIASAIAAVTPSKKDDEVVGKVRKVIALLALNVGGAIKK